ncbi:sigma-54-dependent Fis family transcriptional regulator [Candidatus Clostridium radicumherbarum]|uniref:Sigma-54-dependent Fis family transcriptional regulator n=1 Tax=Candidatus Clostridium radicumherbarum TaxID=3381662 RepID=A0ABW8TPH9_9CLOT
MEEYMQFILEAWEEFTEKDNINPKVKKDIAESWKRCKRYKVDYMSGLGNDIYKVPIETKVKENAELISTAHPIMKNLYSIVAGSGFAIILSDREGYIIDVIGDEDIMHRANELKFVKGALWTEKAVGTNAIGTALYLDKPIQTIGAEHYGINQHSWTCSAAPIHDEDGTIIGCINMSGIYYKAHSHTLGIVTLAAEAIQNQLSLLISYNLLNITFDSISEGMIVTDKNFNIQRINDRSTSILGVTKNEILRMNILNMLKGIDLNEIRSNSYRSFSNVDCDIYIKDKRIKCIINTVPLMVNEKLEGVVITFIEAKYVHKLVNKMIGYKASYRFEDFITGNEEMKKVIEFAKKASKSDCNILIEGESGTGKELIAQSIHNYSKRCEGPFVAINCASIPRELVESELFGYDRGAFTGAVKEGHPGKFELADGGTIFLDEIGELPLDIQSKLLRVLDNNKISRVGGTYEKELNVRIIGATNRKLKEEINKKNFREDLYYRLNVMNIKTLPLYKRKEDIELLSKHFVRSLNNKNKQGNKVISEKYIEALKEYNWPGNVRELRNTIEREYYLSEGNTISGNYSEEKTADKERDNWNIRNKIEDEVDEILTFDILERKSIEKALKYCSGNINKAAELLNISRATIYRKIKKYNINNLLYQYEKNPL